LQLEFLKHITEKDNTEDYLIKMNNNTELNAINGILKFIGILLFTLILFFGFYKISFGAITDDANYASITWTATVSGAISSYNYDTATFQSWNNGSTWGAFTVATWTGYFGSFTHIRVFDGNCSALSMASCEALGNGYADYWVDGSNWSPTDPSSGPVYGCTDPLANNYDPEATDDDDSCTYDSELPDFTPLYSIPFEGYITASTTCIYVATGTYQCNATSTVANTATYHDWLFVVGVIIFLISFITWGYFFSVFKTTS